MTPQVSTERAALRRRTAVAVDIAAPPAAVWALLTDAAGMPAWNRTVTRIEGSIAAGLRTAA